MGTYMVSEEIFVVACFCEAFPLIKELRKDFHVLKEIFERYGED